MIVATLLLLVTIAVRFFRLGLDCLWCDEAYTAWMIQKPLGEMLTTLIQTDDAPPFFYIAQKIITSLTGRTEFGLRFLSALCGCLSVFYLIRRWIREGDLSYCWSAAFFALSSFSIFYARQTRSYGLIMLLIFIVILSARDLLRGRTREAGPLLLICGSLLVLTHNIGGIVAFCCLPLWFFQRWSGGETIELRQWLRWVLPPVIVCVVWLALSRSQLGIHASLNQWMGGFWESHNLLSGPWLTCRTFLPGSAATTASSIALPAISTGKTIWFSLSILSLMIVLFAAVKGCRRNGRWQELLMPGTFLLLPLGALLIVSLFWTPVYVVGRSDVIAFPAFVLLIGSGLSRLPRWGAVSILFFWGAVSLISLQPTYGLGNSPGMKHVDRSVAAFLADNELREDDWLIHSFLTQPSLSYYLSRSGTGHHAVWFPEEAGFNPAGVAPVVFEELDQYLTEAIALRKRIEADLPEDGQVFLIATIDPRYAGDPARWRAPGAQINANQITFPTSLMLYSFVGVNTVTAARTYRQDWIGGERVILPVPKKDWLRIKELPPIQSGDN